MKKDRLNLARVGDDALSLIFKPFQTEKWKRESNIVRNNFDNLGGFYLDRFPKTGEWIDSTRVSVSVYGLETGVVPVTKLHENDQRTISEVLGYQIKWQDLEKFSHVVITISCCRTFPGRIDGDFVTTYRLTPHAKRIISAQDWREDECL